MKKSLLLASLMVITESAFGIHDHPRINSNQDHIVQNLTPISNIEVTPDRSSLNEWSDIETIDEGSYSGTPQRQNSSGSRKRISENELKKFTDKRRRIVTLQNIRNSLNAFSKGKMKEEEGTQTARDIWNIFQDIDSLNFLSKTLQLQREVKESKSFIADLSSMLGNAGETNSSVLLENVENLKKGLSKSKAELDKLNIEKAEAEQQLAEANKKEDKLKKDLVRSEIDNQHLRQKAESYKAKYQGTKAEYETKHNNLKKKYYSAHNNERYYGKKAKYLETKLSETKQKVRDLETKLSETKQEDSSSKQQSDEIKLSLTELDVLRSENDQLNRSLTERNGELNNSYCENNQLKWLLDALRSENDQLNRSLTERNGELNYLSNEKERLSQLLEKRDSENDQLKWLLDDLNRSLAEKDKELNISKYMDEINFQRIKNLSEGNAMLTSQRDMKYLNEKLNHQKMELREDVYFRLQELKEKEWFLDQFLAIEKNLTDFLNTIILYKKNMSISEILEKITGGYRKEAKVLDEELLKQDFKGKLNNLFAKKYTNIAEDYSYTKYTKKYKEIYETLRAEENEKVLNERYYEDTRTDILRLIDKINRSFEKVKKSIDEKIPTIRKLREEQVIKDFFEKISEIKYFRILMEYVDRHLDGNYEAISRVRTYKYDKK
ncbi:MAG: hypothetical protein J6T29_01985 [Alphaproteobacteria bacterium]|nr:hypothetical protein [Alphaproteobacteria bacterium]